MFSLAVAGSYDYLGLSIALISLLVAWILNKEPKCNYTIIDLSFYFLVLLLFLNLFILNQATLPLANYIVTSFLCGYLIFSVVDENQIFLIYKILIITFCLLSIWAFIQFVFNIAQISHFSHRASAIFANPNTYGAAINLLLLPLINIYLVNEKYKTIYLYVAIIILFASLVATQSRGAWIAFAIAFISIFLFSKIAYLKIKKALIKKLLIGLLVTLFSLSGLKLFINYNHNSVSEVSNIETFENNVEYILPYKVNSSLTHRQELYSVAWKNIKENSVFGVGFLNFVYFNYRDTVDYIYGKSLYVHNDYLQIWLELGLIGIIAYLFLIVVTYWRGLNLLRRSNREKQVWIISLLCGLTTFFIHGLASYVFYTPLLACIVASYLAVLSNNVSTDETAVLLNYKFDNKVLNLFVKKAWLIKMLTGFSLSILLLGHALGQISSRAGVLYLKNAQIDKASHLFNLARNLSPTVPEYYLIEANGWKTIALNNHDPIAANRADSLYEEANLNNAYDMRSRLYRAMLHRDEASLLESPVPNETIIEWLEYALHWRPHHHKIQAEYLRTLESFGRSEEAKLLLLQFMNEYPDSRLLKKVYNEFNYLNDIN